MASFTIIGTGNMGKAIGSALSDGGNEVGYVSHQETGTVTLGDVVVLAVPYSALEGIVDSYGDQLAGKTLVDITNPVNQATFDSLTVPAGSSAAAELQEKVPTASVLKAFNTNFAATIASKTVGGQPTTVLIAGDDAAAKQVLAEALTSGGLKAVDAGPLSRAHELESVGFLQIKLAAGEKISWSGGFAVTD